MVYRASGLRGLAITQMVIGNLMVIFGVASIFAVSHGSSGVGWGIWIGIWVIISGILGYLGAKDDTVPNKSLIGCFMGFSIPGCVLSAIMFIAYSVALSDFSRRLRCGNFVYYFDRDCYDLYYMSMETARNGVGLGACLLILAIVEFFIALASSIYCCNTVCCSSGSSDAPQVTFVPAQPTYPGGQSSVVILPDNSNVTSVTTVPAVYTTPIQQQPMYIQQQPMQQIQTTYWTSGGAVPVTYVGGEMMQNQQPYMGQEMPPSYYTTMNTAVPPVASDAPPPGSRYPPSGTQYSQPGTQYPPPGTQ